MHSRVKRIKLTVAMLASGGIALATGVASCASMGFEGLSGATDFCFLFNCNDGLIGGLIDPCSPIYSVPNTPGFFRAEEGEGNVGTEGGANLFSDCPDDETP